MEYNHHRKAGNEGDCPKHPSLIAALDTILDNHPETNKLFHYLDIFSGHAWHPLLDEDEVTGVQKALEWRNGIGHIHTKLWESNNINKHVQYWRNWYLPQQRPLVRGWYPGSSVIAGHVCKMRGRDCRMTLFDYSDEVQADLRRFFQPVQPTEMTKGDWCVIGRSLVPTAVKEDAIQEPDFVFIDPPGWWSTQQPSYPKWEEFFKHVLEPRSKRPTLMWMPAGGQETTKNKKEPNKENPGAYPWDEKSKSDQFKKCKQLKETEYSWSAVRWQKNSYDSCILAYNCAEDAVRAAIDCIVRIAGNSWEQRHSTEIS